VQIIRSSQHIVDSWQLGNASRIIHTYEGRQQPGGDAYLFLEGADEILGHIEEFLTGTRASVEADRILATVLFTDIVGSTERAAALGDRRWRDLLDRHHGAVRKELQRFRGREIDTAGDGFFVPLRERPALFVVHWPFAKPSVHLELRFGRGCTPGNAS